jgi:lipopolysaccharide/colanic/teichoic acid biosynthesis glycosyltransferase
VTFRSSALLVRAGLFRGLDVLVSSAALALVSPLLLIIALAIVVDTGRPVFFVQARIGWDGRRFRMYKYRKFRADCADGLPLTMKDDRRLTRVGRFLAASKLDELPQLVNILRGEMSVVGPRPESLAFEDCFCDRFRAVLAHRPGIFGPSQVAFRNECALYPSDVDPTGFYRETLFPMKAALDLAYYPQRTVLSDLGWLLRGVLAAVGAPPPTALAGDRLLATSAGPSRAIERTDGSHSHPHAPTITGGLL